MINKKSRKFVIIISIFCLIILVSKLYSKHNADNMIETINNGGSSLKKYVYPLGELVGVKASTDGVLVVGYEDEDIEYIGGIQKGDNIVEINDKKISSSDDVEAILKNVSGKTVKVKYERNNEYIYDEIKVKYENNQAKLGLWVRDRISGVGTLTFYDPSSSKFSAIGHSITDVDTNEFLSIREGSIYNLEEFQVSRATNSNTGKIDADINENEKIGEFNNNTDFGISGKINGEINSQSQLIEVGNREDVKLGKASILFEDENENVRSYNIEIKEFISKSDNNRDMIIEIKDEELIEYTGGIIQGMSGAPIIQDNKLIGVVTHVFKENSKKGYGIFIDEMIELDKRY